MSFKCVEPDQLYPRDPNLKKEDVQIVQEWLKKQPHLPQIHESQILFFLHSCYYRVEAAKVFIDNYFTIRTLCPILFKALTPELVQTNGSVGCVRVLPQQTPDRNDILFLKLIDSDLNKFNCNNLINLVNMVSVLFLHQYGSYNGAVAIFDMKGFTLAHASRLNLSSLKQVFYFVQEAIPVRIREIHVINCASYIDRVMALVKPFLKKELYNMIRLHPPNSETLYETIPKDCLPEEYGGKAPSINILNEENLKNILDNYDFFVWHDGQKVDESKRMGKAKITNDVFGVDGTFKKLEID